MFESGVGINWVKVCSIAVQATGKYAVYISNGNSLITPKENIAWDWLMNALKLKYGTNSKLLDNLSIAIINSELVFFDTKEDMQTFYSFFEQELTYSGPIYACTYDSAGIILNENT